MKYFITLLIIAAPFQTAFPQFPPGAGAAGTTAIDRDSSVIYAWASTISITPGFINSSEKEIGRVENSDLSLALGYADNLVISLGDSGVVVLGFDTPFSEHPGADFAVFENSFDGRFLELAKVAVSSDSLRWVEFPSYSLVDNSLQIDPFGNIDPEKVHNLAGKYKALYGTPFDLEDISDSAGIDIDNVRYVKITDVIGDVNSTFPVLDSEGSVINDPWPTPFESSGFDLDAVALLGLQTTIVFTVDNSFRIYPNPASYFITVDYHSPIDWVSVTAVDGRFVKRFFIKGLPATIDISDIPEGFYLLSTGNPDISVLRLIIYR